MSCPDWTVLTAHRGGSAAAAKPEPAGWDAALDHLDGCDDCRRRALAADPSLLFRRLAGGGAPIAVDVEAMRQGVAAMRRARRLLPAEERRRPRRGWSRAAAAVLLTAGLLAAGAGGHPPSATPGAEVAAVTSLAVSPALPAAGFGGAVFAAAPAARAVRESDDLPVFEGLDRPRDANIYQLDGEGLLVVMIVDETLDV